MGAIDLLKSERGLLALAIIIASTVLAALGYMTIAEWKETTMWIFGIFVAGKSATTVAGILKGGGGDANEAPGQPTPVPPSPPQPGQV